MKEYKKPLQKKKKDKKFTSKKKEVIYKDGTAGHSEDSERQLS